MPAYAPKLDARISEQLRVAGLLATLMVLSRHSMNMQAFYGTDSVGGVVGAAEYGMSILTEIAVPWFFFVSGFFFFRHNYYERGAYEAMLKKKARTLLFPFLFWNIINLPFYLYRNPDLINASFFKWLEGLALSQWDGPLWYVRDLILLMMLVPIYQWMFAQKYRWVLLPVLFAAFWFWIPIDCSVLSSEGVMFFLLGGALAKLPQCLSYKLHTGVLIFISLFWISGCFSMVSWSNVWLHKCTTIMGAIVFWQWTNRLHGRVNSVLLQYAEYSFFIYVCHFYPLKFIKVLVAHYFTYNDVAALATFFFLPIIVAGIFIIVGSVLKRVIPKVYYLSTGGR